ncbi:lipopolysaccharide transport system permease protein [Methanobrevibacter gottschalkii]|uniref:Lipopolysaccharide transport system permease protein n=1 Tax=Methanobrevibacter gottschalkii TaxID=190974 RepID=A0A1H7MYQ3_9EURY|nr:lipopolysaccharide transport system permease protein [Methanobrevibacter gottschalkii]
MILINENELFLLEEIVKRNFSSKYKDSVLGIFWSILRPLLMMILLTIIFSTLFRWDIMNYPVYLLSGRCIFDFFSASTNLCMYAIKGNKNILQKTAAPKHIFILGSVISEFMNFFITLIILIVVMIITNNPFYLNIIPLSIIPIISLLLLVTGIGLILSIVAVYFSDIQHLWGVFILGLMYASAIFYPMDIVPNPFHKYLVLNPLFWIIDQFRDLMLLGVIPNSSYIINSLLLSTIVLVFGVIVFVTYERFVALKF